MKAIFKRNPSYGAEIVDVPIPYIKDNEVLIKVDTASICGTDIHIYTWDKWAQSRVNTPLIFGHEFAGKVVEVGKNVSKVSLDDFVSAETHVVCEECFQCRNGQKEVCQNVKILGVDIQGCFAEYVAVPEANVWKNDKSLRPEYASIQEPFGNSVYALFGDDESIEGKNIVILGCGPTGLFATTIAKACGAKQIISVDINDYRLKLADMVGADHILNPYKGKYVDEAVMDFTNGVGADIVLEMSGSKSAFNTAMKVSRAGGRITLFGLSNQNLEVDLNSIVFGGKKILGITGRKIWSTWEKTQELMGSGKLELDPIVTHVFPMSCFEKAFELMKEGKSGKIIMYP